MNPEQEPRSNVNEQSSNLDQPEALQHQPVVSPPQGGNKQKAAILAAVFIAVLIAVGAALFVVLRGDDDSSKDSQTTSSNSSTTEAQIDNSTGIVEKQNSSSAQKTAANNLLAGITEYSANNTGRLPSTDTELQKIATDSGLSDISVQVKESYIASDVPADQNTFYYYQAHTCSEDTNTPVAGSSREFAVLYNTPSGLECAS